ncbi:ADAM protease ADM-B [Xylariales sp. PMI_506]|nr:ADAM protease ADM-B [Xylariales sp. PMI_506]
MRGLLKASAAFLLALAHSAEAHSTKRNALNSLSSLDNPVLHAPSHRVNAYSSFELTFSLHNENEQIRLTLEPNHDVISDSTYVQYLAPDGTVYHEEPIVRSDHKVYKGNAFIHHPYHAEWIRVGWARITVHRDGVKPIFEGTFRIYGDHHHVQTSTNYVRTQHHEDPVIDIADDEYMVVWRDSDIMPDIMPDDGTMGELKRGLVASTCESDQLDFNADFSHPVYRALESDDVSTVNGRRLFGRQIDSGSLGGNSAGVNLSSTIGSTAGCPTSRKVALVGIATDCTYTADFNSSSSARANIIQVVNSASQVYESTFNISLGIQNLTISDATCPGTAPSTAPWNVACSSSTTITDRLNLFSGWRGNFNDTNAYWTLMSTCNTDAAVGLAWLGQLCAEGASTGANETTAGANVVVRTSTEWQVFAHETGHTFGAVHDCISTTCSDGTVTMQQCCPLSDSTCNANGAYIMNPSTGSGIDTFSPCTVGNICSALGRNSVKSTCLTNNKDVVTITGSQCGNGIVEPGEDCDCGGDSGCADNTCCDGSTCKFKSGAVCDPSNEDCCTSQCLFASNGTVCRASTGSCDPQEMCTGSSPNCPADELAPNGQSCGASGAGLTCASGQCTSRDLQCKTIVGSLTTDNNTYACNSQDCQLSCASSKLGPNTCYDLQQYFLDGTPCQGGGECNNGQCEGANLGNEVSSWLSDNKNIVIPVASVIGGLILLALATCCIGAWRKRTARRRVKPTQPNASWQGGPVWNASNMAPPPPAARGARLSRRGQPPPYAPYMGQPQTGPQRVTAPRYA